MKMTYVLSQKIKIALSLTILIIMLLVTNFLSKRHFSELQKSFSSVYEDRLLVEIHIYKITTFLNEKNILIHENYENKEAPSFNKYDALNDSIAAYIVAYEKTVFTPQEAEVFELLKNNLAQLIGLEDSIGAQVNPTKKHDLLLKVDKCQAKLTSNLTQLSGIQREEGKRLLNQSNQLVSSSKVTLQFELVILIVTGLIVQALIFSSKSTMPKFKQNSRLN